jgi:hypothetical protein
LIQLEMVLKAMPAAVGVMGAAQVGDMSSVTKT